MNSAPKRVNSSSEPASRAKATAMVAMVRRMQWANTLSYLRVSQPKNLSAKVGFNTMSRFRNSDAIIGT